MTCRKTRMHLALFSGGDLSRRKERAVRAHLHRCPGCRTEAEDYRAAIERFNEMAAEGTSLDWTEVEWRRAMAAVNASPPKKELPRIVSLMPKLAATASFLLVVWATQYAVRFMLRTAQISSTSAAEPSGGNAAFGRASLAAVARIAGLQDPKFPLLSSTKQDVPALTMISPESGLKIVWFFNEYFRIED